MTALLRRLALAVVCLAVPAWAQEMVDLDLPGPLEVKVFEPGRAVAAVPSRLGFRHALLLPGRRLRISVRACGVGEGEEIRSLSFAATNAEGGAGLQGKVGGQAWTPVFEGRPFAVSGGVEILWKLDTAPRIARAGSRPIELRWRVESVAGSREEPAPPGRAPRGKPGPGPAPSPRPFPSGEGGRREGGSGRDAIQFRRFQS